MNRYQYNTYHYKKP